MKVNSKQADMVGGSWHGGLLSEMRAGEVEEFLPVMLVSFVGRGLK